MQQGYKVMPKFLTISPEVVAAYLKMIHWRGICLVDYLAPSRNGRLIFAAGKIGSVDIPSSLFEFGRHAFSIFRRFRKIDEIYY
jgi:hypothetical protein